MKRVIYLTLLASTLPATALAWRHIGEVPNEPDQDPWAWPADEMPIEFWVADDDLVSGGHDPNEGGCEETVPVGYCRTAATQGFAAWNDAECAEISAEYQGWVPNTTGFTRDQTNRFTYNDPEQTLDTGTLGATVCYGNAADIVLNYGGRNYKHPFDCDIVFNDNVNFTTHEQVVRGQCADATNMLSVYVHEIGHLLGMDHSCGEFEDCNGIAPVIRDATMFWSDGPCSVEQSTINEDDIQGITALYGPSAQFQCSNLVNPDDPEDSITTGNVPFDLRCSVQSGFVDELVEAAWFWGDGGQSDTFPKASHTYEEPGNYTVRVRFVGERDSCGSWRHTARRVGYVRACDVPDAQFTVEHEDGLTFTLLNETDVSTFGCITDIQWDIYKGKEAPVCEPINKCQGAQTAEDGCIEVPRLPDAAASDDEWDAYDATKKIWDAAYDEFDACAEFGGKRVGSLRAWEPDFTFPDDGDYTVVLNVHGQAGTGVAQLTFEAFKRRGEGRQCSYLGAGSATGFGILAMGLIGLARRRRS